MSSDGNRDLGTRVTIRLPDDQLAAIRDAVAAGEAPSVSAYISRALNERPPERFSTATLLRRRAERFGRDLPGAEHFEKVLLASGEDPDSARIQAEVLAQELREEAG